MIRFDLKGKTFNAWYGLIYNYDLTEHVDKRAMLGGKINTDVTQNIFEIVLQHRK